MAIVQWDPFGEITSLRQQMDRILGRHDSEQTFVPPVDVFENDGQIVIKAELPGIDPSDVEVSIDENVLSIRGERRFKEKTEQEGFYRIERRYGRFERYLPLPQGTDAEQIQASYDSGILDVRVPKPEQMKPRRLDIQRTSGGGQIGMSGESGGMPGGKTPERGSDMPGSSGSEGNVPKTRGVDMDKVSRSEMPFATEREVEEGVEPPSDESRAA